MASMDRGGSGSGSDERPRAWWVGGLVLVCQWAWLGWCLTVTLPNASTALRAEGVSRGLLAMYATPGLVPGIGDENLLSEAWRELSRVDRLGDRAPVVLAGLAILGTAWGLGALALRATGLGARLGRWERVAASAGVGMGLASLLALGLGRAGWFGPSTARALALAAMASGVWASRGWGRGSEWVGVGSGSVSVSGSGAWRRFWGEGWWLLVPGGALTGVMLLGAMLPTVDFDALEYHLQGPKEYYLGGRIRHLPHNVYTSMPFQVEMLHYWGMTLLDDWFLGASAGQFAVGCHIPLGAWFAGMTAARWGGRRAGFLCGLLYVSTPWMYRMGALPYVEGPLCATHAGLIWATARAWTRSPGDRRGSDWLLAGVLAGQAMAIKYPGLVSAVIPFGCAACAGWGREGFRRGWVLALAFAAGASAMAGPWLAKNVADTGNPVYPLAWGVFGGGDRDAALDAKWRAAHGRKEATWGALGESALDVLGRSDWQSPLLAAFAPLALARRATRRAAFWIGGHAVWVFGTWWLLTHRLDRFWLPLTPGLAILAAWGAGWPGGAAWRSGSAASLAFMTYVNMVICVSAVTAPTGWTTPLEELRTRYARIATPLLVELEGTLPAGSKVLLVGQAAVFHARFPLLYNTVFDREIIEELARGRTPRETWEALRGSGITHVYVEWPEIARYRSPGNYGYTDFTTPEFFEGLAEAGALRRTSIRASTTGRDLYEVPEVWEGGDGSGS